MAATPPPDDQSPKLAPPESAGSVELLREPSSAARSRSWAEWITFTITATVLCVLVALVIVDWVVTQDRPPAFTVQVVDRVRLEAGRYYVPFSIQNTGGRVARTVQVTAELHIDGLDDETGEQQIDFLSGQEIKRGSFVFNHNPKDGEITLRVASYRSP